MNKCAGCERDRDGVKLSEVIIVCSECRRAYKDGDFWAKNNEDLYSKKEEGERNG